MSTYEMGTKSCHCCFWAWFQRTWPQTSPVEQPLLQGAFPRTPITHPRLGCAAAAEDSLLSQKNTVRRSQCVSRSTQSWALSSPRSFILISLCSAGEGRKTSAAFAGLEFSTRQNPQVLWGPPQGLQQPRNPHPARKRVSSAISLRISLSWSSQRAQRGLGLNLSPSRAAVIIRANQTFAGASEMLYIHQLWMVHYCHYCYLLG